MLRAFLLIVAVALLICGGAYWFAFLESGYNSSEKVTVPEVIADPVRWSSTFASRNARVEDVEVDLGGAVNGGTRDPGNVLSLPRDSDQFHYIPVKGSNGKLYLFIAGEPPTGPFTVVGKMRYFPVKFLPPALVEKATDEKLLVLYYGNGDYANVQKGSAKPLLFGAAAALGLAVVLQALTVVNGRWRQRQATKAIQTSTSTAGKCTLCGAEGPRAAVTITAEKRRMVGQRKAQTTWSRMPAECCRDCLARLGDLGWISVVGKVAMVPLIFGMVGGVVLLFAVGKVGGVLLGIAIGLFCLLQFWIHRYHNRILTAPVHVALKKEIEVTIWNPLADTISAG